jgi:ParB-like nuclease domain
VLISIDEIKTKNRVRSGDPRIEPLMGSMAKYGLLNPIIVDSKNNLIAGYRRLEAARALGWKTICGRLRYPWRKTPSASGSRPRTFPRRWPGLSVSGGRTSS